MRQTSSYQARYCSEPPFARDNGKLETAAQANGRRYEEKALPFLEAWAQNNGYTPKIKPWIEYFDEGGKRCWCQPDFVAIGETTDNLLVIEVKLRHTREAFKQLGKYCRLLAELHPNHRISPLELCRIFDNSEFATTLFSEVRPHELPHAAALFEPRQWTPAIN